MLKAISDFLNSNKESNQESEEDHSNNVEAVLKQVLSQLNPQEKKQLADHVNTETGTSAHDVLQQLISNIITHVSANSHQLQSGSDEESMQKFSDNLHKVVGGVFGTLLTKVFSSEAGSTSATTETTSTQGVGNLLQKVLPLLITTTVTHATKNVDTDDEQLKQISNKLTAHLNENLQSTLTRRGVDE